MFSIGAEHKVGMMPTFMFRLLDQLAHHGLDDSNVSICQGQPMHPKIDATYLLNSPPKALPANATQICVEKPTMSNDMRVPAHPIIKTGFRPIRSDTPPHAKPVKDSAREKEEMKTPAQKEAVDLSPTPKSSTITHAYGKLWHKS